MHNVDSRPSPPLGPRDMFLSEFYGLLIKSAREINEELFYQLSTSIHNLNIMDNVNACRYLLQIIQLLADHGADFNVRNHYGQTLLHISALRNHNFLQKGFIEVLRLLIDHGLNVNAKSTYGEPLIVYSHYNSYHTSGSNIIKLLIEKGAILNIKDNRGWTLLHFFASNNNIELLELMIQKKMNIHSIDNNGNTPLLAFSQMAHRETKIAETLLNHGAHVDVENIHGYTPILESCKLGNIQLAELFLNRGANVNNKTLISAALNSKNSFYPKAHLLFLLLLYGATPNKDDEVKINKDPDLKNCLTMFEKIEAQPHIGNLIRENKDTNFAIVSDYLYSKNKGLELLKEVQDIKNKYFINEELSFRPECLANFLINIFTKFNEKYTLREAVYYIARHLREQDKPIQDKSLGDIPLDGIIHYLKNQNTNNICEVYIHDKITGCNLVSQIRDSINPRTRLTQTTTDAQKSQERC